MAAVLTAPDTAKAVTARSGSGMVHFAFPISKSRDTETVNPVDGTPDLEIWGKVTDGTLDSDLQIVDPEWSLTALKTWFDTKANVRMAHDPKRPIGRGIELDGHFVKALISEPVAKHLIRTKVLNDWSVGILNPDIRKGDPRFRHLDPMGKAIEGIITGRDDGLSQIGEISACDRGSNYGTAFQIAKSAADGSCEFTGKVLGADDYVTKAEARRSYKTVSVDLPASMRIKVSPATLAKMNTMAQRNAAPAVTRTAEPAQEKAAVTEPEVPEALKAVMAAEGAVYKRDIDTATRRRLAGEGRALSNLSYPIETHEDAGNAVTLALSGHGNVAAAKKLIRRIARKEGWQDILGRLGGKKKDKQAKAGKAAVCDVCKGTGLDGGKPCISCGKGAEKALKMLAQAAAVFDGETPASAAVTKKSKVMCGHCGAKQNSKHVHCPECGGTLRPGAMPVAKNHDFTCLGCGKDLDKGEKYCPQCGRENPGYLPEADQKIPANMDAEKSGTAVRERVDDASVAKGRKKGKKAKKAGKEPFGGSQAKPFGAKDDGDGDEAKEAKKAAAAQKRRKGGKGKGRSPAVGSVAQDPAGLPPHREPDGPAVEAFEHDTQLEEGDEREEMAAAMARKNSGIDPDLGVLHDLTCPAYSPATVTRAFPHATFASISTDSWQRKALDAASGGSMAHALDAYNEAAALSRHAVTLKTADAQVLHDLRLEHHAAFLDANKDALKTFRDATPGPGTFPSPSHPMPGQFRRPYISAGHGAPSPQHDGPRTFPPASGSPVAQDFTRDHLTAGHAADAPANDTPRHESQPAPSQAGKPGRVYYQNTVRDNARQAMTAMHDHISRMFPDVCPVYHDGANQKPAPAVPEAVGGPVPHSGKAAKPKGAKTAKAAGRKVAAKRRRLERQVLKGKVTVDGARAKLGLQPFSLPETQAPVPAAQPALEPEAIAAAVKAATAPLARRIARQDKALRKNAKVLGAIAGERDTAGAPFRGAGVAKTATTSATLAGPLTAVQSAEQAQTVRLQMLHKEWRTSPDPAMREAAYRAMTDQLGLNPVTQSGPIPMHPPMT